MLARSFRLRRAHDINKVYKQGSFVHGQYVLLRARQTHLPLSRVAVIVSKKISPRATVRNRYKRQVSECIHLSWAQILPGFDILVTIKTDLGKATPTGLKGDVVSVLKKAKLTKV